MHQLKLVLVKCSQSQVTEDFFCIKPDYDLSLTLKFPSTQKYAFLLSALLWRLQVSTSHFCKLNIGPGLASKTICDVTDHACRPAP